MRKASLATVNSKITTLSSTDFSVNICFATDSNLKIWQNGIRKIIAVRMENGMVGPIIILI